MKSKKISANPFTMYKARNRVDKKPKIIKTPHFHLVEKLELPLEDPVWYPTAVKSGQSISIKAMVEYLNIAPAIDRKAVLLIRAYDDAGNEVEIQLDKMFRSEAFGAYFVYLPSTQSEVTELYTFVVPEGVSTIHFGFSRFLCSDNEQVVVSDLTIYPQAVVQSSKKIETASNHLIEKLELPLEDPVWCPTTVETGQSISIKAMVEYLNIAPAIDRKAVLLIRAYDDAGNEVNVQLDKMFRSEAFGAYFIYLPSTQSEVTELYTFVVPEGVSTIHFGFSRFLCSDDEQVVVSDLNIYSQAEIKSPKSIDLLGTHYVEKLELPLEEPIWYPTSVHSGQAISIKALVDYLNIDLTNNRKAVLLIRSYDETGNEVDVQLDKTFKSEAFGAYFIYIPSTQSKVTELYTFVVPEGISTIYFGFIKFLCSDDEQVLVSNLTIEPQAVMLSEDIAAIIKVQDDYQEAYEKLAKFRKNIEIETSRFLEEIKSVSELNLVTSTLLHNTKGIVHTADIGITDKKNKVLKSTEIGVPKKDKGKLKNSFTQGLTLLDPISEECWADTFNGYGVVNNSYVKQVETTKSDFAFFESAWKANKGEWLYAFNSPDLQHDNAQKLLDVIGKLREKSIPVIFWNKEDPMHYEMFKPIAKEADYVFTTDSQIVEKYRKELNNPNVWALSFAAPVSKTNPIDRFSGIVENVCFAGTYYAKNHPDRKRQMDKLLPTLLDNDGFIYNRVSENKSDNYAYPSEYNEIIREGVGFEEMIELYKKFKIFLNVNTIVNSPTMMSRRVYELLASGTPVVSTPSKAITAQFPGIVLTATNKEEANIAVGNLLGNSYFWHRQSVLGIREVMLKHTYQIRWEYIKNCIADKEASDDSLNEVSIIAKYTGLIGIEGYIETLLNQNNIKLNKLIIINSSKNLSKNLVEKVLESDENAQLLIVDSYNDAINELKEVSSDYVYFTEDSIINFQNAVLDLVLANKYTKSKAITRQAYYSFEELKDKPVNNVDLNIDNANWYKTINETSLRSVLVDRLFLDMYTINPSKWEVESAIGDNDIFIIDPFNIVSVEKPKNNRLINYKTVSNFIYKYNSWLGI